MRVSTPLIYPGGKTLLLPHIRPLVPPHNRCLDLFGGGGAFILDDTHTEGVYNDLNDEAVNFFRVLRNDETRERLIELLRDTPYSRKEYFDCDSTWRDCTDMVERARCWFVVVNMGFTHQEDCHSFRVGVSNGVARALRNHVDDLPLVVDRLRSITIECLDWRKALEIYGWGADTLVFADPPYLTTKEGSLQYAHAMSVADHYDLLVALDATDTMVILCGYASEMYNDMLRRPKWELVKKVRIAHVGNSDYKHREMRTEHIWVKKSLGGLWA